MGIPSAAAVSTSEELTRVLTLARRGTGPWTIVAKVDESAPIAKPPLDCVFIKQRFMYAMGAQESATAGSAT
jgi:hypothetical protein